MGSSMAKKNLSYQKFTSTAQTGSVLVRTFLCLKSLIEDLLGEGHDFALRSRFQSNPLERRFGQFGQMGGGMCLVALSEKCPYSELFWSVFSRIRTEYGEILCPNAGKCGLE